jgi:hypothetical protein
MYVRISALIDFAICDSTGIEWDEDAVYKYFCGPPNNWSPQEVWYNVLRKIPVSEVDGGPWDPLVRCLVCRHVIIAIPWSMISSSSRIS